MRLRRLDDKRDTLKTENASDCVEMRQARDDDPMRNISNRLDEIDSLLRRLAKASEMNSAELIDARDSAELLGLARSTFLSRVNTGEIGDIPIRIGGSVSWRR